MKFDNQKVNVKNNMNKQPQTIKSKIGKEGKDPIDDFHAAVFNSGNKLLTELDKQGVEMDPKLFSDAELLIRSLEGYQYKIAFAGEQSSGKSTVINSLINYPLMPTCRLTTTCVGTTLIYSDKPRIIVTDDDIVSDDHTKKRILDVDCTNISEQHFKKLKEYACGVSRIKLVENLQYFTDRNLFNKNESLTPELANELKMDRNNPNHVVLLVMILLTVYVNQNSEEFRLDEMSKQVISKRNEILRFFGFPSKTVNYSITLLWNGDFLKSGMTIIDLPGLGANAHDKDVSNKNGKVQLGHDSITTNVLASTADAMVFLVDPEVKESGSKAIGAMLNNASLKKRAKQGDFIVPILNKVDTCEGDAIIDQAVDAFRNLIVDAGVNKKKEDIWLCSSWFGEVNYSEFPIERTLFYKRNFAQEYRVQLRKASRRGNEVNEAVVLEEVKSSIQDDLEDAYYDLSHIEELKKFFRSAYVQKGKCDKVYDALSEIRTLSQGTLEALRLKKKNYGTLKDLQSDVIARITRDVADYASAPIHKAFSEINPLIDEPAIEEVTSRVESELAPIPKKYTSAFSSALTGYRSKLSKIANEFELFAFGFGFSARIDQNGSRNRRLYLQLLDECESMNINIKSVNESYAKILDFVSDDISVKYSKALEMLRKIKGQFAQSMKRSVDGMLKDKELQGATDAIKSLSDSVVNYVEKQIVLLEEQAELSKTSINQAETEVANSIISINSESVSTFSRSVVKEIKGALKPGGFFASKEYLKVDGNDGIKELINNLSFSSTDKQFMENSIKTTGITVILNNINAWYSEASLTIRSMFTELGDQVKKLMESTTKMLSKDVYENERNYENVVQQISVCERELIAFRKEVQPFFDLSLTITNNKNQIGYQSDIFKGLQLKG